MNTSAIFFDNDRRHIEEVEDCRNIICIKVPGMEGLPREMGVMELSDEDFIEHVGDASGDFINFLVWVNGGEQDRFDPTSGMNIEHERLLVRWLEESANRRERWAIFDFDRTISKIEGFASVGGGIQGLNDLFRRPISAAEYMTYLCGKSRIQLLTRMFQLCKDNYVKIVILTNNGACTTDRQLIADFMKVLGVQHFQLICSRSYESDKGRALHAELMDACPSLF